MTASAVGCARLVSHRIIAAPPAAPADLVRHFGAVQAQDYPAALRSIGIRSGVSSEAGVVEAVSDRSLVRSWVLRGTLHFVASSDLRWLLSLLAPRLISSNARRFRQLGLDEKIAARSNDLLRSALAGGRQLTREALYERLEDGGIETGGQRGYHLLWRAAQDQVICWGSRVGKDHTYALVDDWIPPTPAIPVEEALRRLAECYFRSHGPATLADFIWWSGLTAAEARRGLELNASGLVERRIGGKSFLIIDQPSESGPSQVNGAASAYLLPAFDEFIVGYRDRDDVLDPAHAKLVNTGGGMLSPVLVIGGRVVGTWRRSSRKDVVTVTVRRFRILSQDELEAIRVEAESYARFVGLKLNLVMDSA